MMTEKMSAIGDLAKRYASVFSAAWAARQRGSAATKYGDELAFLPANLELVERPVHPAPHWFMRVIVCLGVCAALIGAFGQLDIVVVAKGRLLPDARVKVIQPAVTGIVRSIAVQDGDHVVAGQVLTELDTSQAAADAQKTIRAASSMALAMARASALLEAQERNQPPRVLAVPGALAEDQRTTQQFAEGVFREYRDNLSAAYAELEKREADLETTNAEIEKLVATAPIARKLAQDYRELSEGSYVARHEYLDKEQAAIEAEQELKAQHSHAQELRAAIAQQRAAVAAAASQFRREQLEARDKATQQFTQDTGDATKASAREKMLTIRAPVEGTVQQLSIHTLGGVVTTAQSLMSIVPNDTLVVEATVENQDMGFVEVGQSVTVKLAAFPYTQYGFVKGQVEWLSSDAVQDKKLGAAFLTHVRLMSNRIRVNDKWVSLSPGMEATAEIKTGRRSVLRYFLDPLVQTSEESLHER